MRAAVTIAFTLLLGMGCADPVVGAECREGFAPSGNRCVPVLGDGGDRADASDVDGGVPADGALPDARALADGSFADANNGFPDGGGADAGAGDAATGDAGPPVCDLGELACDGACVRPDVDPDHCGACGRACAATEVCAAGTCQPGCDPPLSMCGGACVDLSSDPNHCGTCTRRCSSGICEDGLCVAATAGHVVVVGHDYRSARRGMNQVAGNAVFLAPGNPVRVAAYEGDAVSSSIRGIDRAIDQVAADTGRSWEKRAVGPSQVSFELAVADVFVVYPQRDTLDSVLLDLGTSWAVALESFLERGGVVVVFDGAGSNDGTWQVLEAAGLFAATGRADVSGERVRVVSPGDAVALSVPLSYRGETSTVRFETAEATAVVSHDDGPVVVHRVLTD